MELKICHLFPDILNLYGDRGNVVCMQKRLNWRSIDVSVTAYVYEIDVTAGFFPADR